MTMDEDKHGLAAEYALGTLEGDERAQADALLLFDDAGRAALSDWQEADSESARALLTAFVSGRLQQSALLEGVTQTSDTGVPAMGQPAPFHKSDALTTINPATGEPFARCHCGDATDIDTAVKRYLELFNAILSR